MAVPHPSAGAEDISLKSSSLIEDLTEGPGDLTLSVGLFELLMDVSSSYDLLSSHSPHRPSDFNMNLSETVNNYQYGSTKQFLKLPVEEHNEQEHQVVESVHLLPLDPRDSWAPERLIVGNDKLVPWKILKLAQVLGNNHHLQGDVLLKWTY
jgi:hypothetical protein